MDAPTPTDVRRALIGLDATRQKIIGGMLKVMIKNPQHDCDREWMARQLAQLTVFPGEFSADTPQAGVEAVQAYLQANAEELMLLSLMLYQRVGLDLAPRAAEGFTFEEALTCGLEYLPSLGGADSPSGETDSKEKQRDFGEQPIARLMSSAGLQPTDLVAASTEQITHKMVARALKGRRLTSNTMGKVQRAFEKATGTSHKQSELFNYKPGGG